MFEIQNFKAHVASGVLDVDEEKTLIVLTAKNSKERKFLTKLRTTLSPKYIKTSGINTKGEIYKLCLFLEQINAPAL